MSATIAILAPSSAAGVTLIDSLSRSWNVSCDDVPVAPLVGPGQRAEIVTKSCVITTGSRTVKVTFVVTSSAEHLPLSVSSYDAVILLPESARESALRHRWPLPLLASPPYLRLVIYSARDRSEETEHEEWCATHGFQESHVPSLPALLQSFPWGLSSLSAPSLAALTIAGKSFPLAGLTNVDLSNCGLTAFPPQLFAAAGTLTTLNLGGNQLSSLPPAMTAFTSLRVLFFANNAFTAVPSVLGSLPSLYMLSFKSNRVAAVPPDSLAPSLGWLILTDNRITELPDSIGACTGMRKLMLANNQLKALPATMARLNELELLRLAANRFRTLPAWLFRLPKLSWLAVGGNPCCGLPDDSVSVPEVSWSDVTLGAILGQGASGVVHACTVSDPAVPVNLTINGMSTEGLAIKLFKGEATSDGLPADEMAAALLSGTHPNLIPVVGLVTGAPSPAVLLPRIPPSYSSLGLPPSFVTVTRDTFSEGTSFSAERALQICAALASVGRHLHARGISHGDLYAHNILIDKVTGHVLLVDFGAASLYDPRNGLMMQPLEVRAFGCLMEDVLTRVDASSTSDCHAQWLIKELWSFQAQCLRKRPSSRPSFASLSSALSRLSSTPATTTTASAPHRERIVYASFAFAAVAVVSYMLRK